MKLKGKKVAVYGMGRSGISTLKLLKREEADLWAINEGDADAWKSIDTITSILPIERCTNEKMAIDLLATMDLIIISPGISLKHPSLALAHKQKVKIWGEIELGSQFNKAPIIAVTGSNGKTTTVTMIGEILKAAGKNVFVGGNIGVPFCEAALSKQKFDYIVLEISSFQLETIENFHPNIAIILNLFQTHGERYETIFDYANAKFNITKNMNKNDLLIYPSDFAVISAWAIQQKTQKISFDTLQIDQIKNKIAEHFSLDKFKLCGNHNISNLYFIIQALAHWKISERAIQKTIDTFGGVPHRVQFVSSKEKFIPYNDAKSTNWDATMTAVRSIEKKGKKLHLIVGGQRRGRDDSITPHISFFKEHVDQIILIGDTADQFADELEGQIKYIKATNLENAIKLERENDFNGIVLFSPAFPSFDQYENYVKRGEHFLRLLR